MKIQENHSLTFPAFAKNLTLYEVNLRQYSPEGNFRGFIAHLPRLKELGAGILWFMPLHPIGELNRKGTLGSYYSVKDFRGIDPAYGSMDDFREVVDRAHSLGLYVILDWVANHSSWDNVLTATHPHFYHKDEKGMFQPPFPEWEDVIHFNYGEHALWEWMTEAMRFWIRETGIDGFRCDMANLVPGEFWKHAIGEIRREKELFMLAEAEDKTLLSAGFDVIYSWDLLHWMNGVVHGKSPVRALEEKLEPLRWASETCTQLLFTSNHDENSWNGTAIERLGIALEACTVLTFTLPGMPLVYSGQEAGLMKRLAFFEKDLIEWKNDKMSELYRRLSSLRMRNPSLWSGPAAGGFRMIKDDPDGRVMAFVREKDNSRVIVCCNFSGSTAEIRFNLHSLQGGYNEILTDQKIFLASQAAISLKPWTSLVLEKSS